MAPLSEIRDSNAQIASNFPPGLVGLFVGATSGIGAGTLKAFVKHTIRPRAYFVGRSQSAAKTIIAECKELNPDGEYIFIQADVSLIKIVDEVCSQIKAKEPALNILFLSQGQPSLDRSGIVTPEGLHLLTALCSYSRLRFIQNLLPLLENAAHLHRVVSVGAAGFEGPIDASDLAGLLIPFERIRGHLASLITLGLEGASRGSSGVTFIHSYPGAVNTPLTRRLLAAGYDAPIKIPVPEDWMSPGESGERHLSLLTSPRYPSAVEHSSSVSVDSDFAVAYAVNGKVGSGVYCIGVDGECVSFDIIDFLAELIKEGLVEKVWEHTQDEFRRITEHI